MANIAGVLQPSDTNAATFTIAATTASGNKTFYANAYLLISVAATAGAAAGVTATFGQVNASQLSAAGAAPTVPSATVGFFINANAPAQLLWLGPNKDTVNFFNNTAATVTVSVQLLVP